MQCQNALAEQDYTQHNSNNHNQIHEYLGSRKALVLGPERVIMLLFGHVAKIGNTQPAAKRLLDVQQRFGQPDHFRTASVFAMLI